MNFSYIKLPLRERSPFFGASLLKPIVPIKILYQDRAVQYAALIDSGADFCIFDAQIGEALGLDVRSGTRAKFGGIQSGGPAEAFLHQLALEIGGRRFNATVAFSYEIAPYGYAILGQKGFFDFFIVKFDLVKEEIEIKERVG